MPSDTRAEDDPVWQTHPLTPERFDDFTEVVNRNRRANHCWCLSHRLTAGQIAELGGAGSDQRERAARALAERPLPPGVVTYRDGVPVGWCSISPREDIPRLVASTLMPATDEVPVWSIICVVVRSGHRKQGVTGHLVRGALEWARSQGAAAVEAHPVDPGDGRVDLTMAFVGIRSMFSPLGFEVVGTTDAVAGGLPRITMRHTF